MADRPIQLILQDESHVEQPESRAARKDALQIVRKVLQDIDTTHLPEQMQDLLLNVFKPLFSRKQHPKLTSTGRKNLVESAIPSNLTRFNDENPFDQANRPLWKNGWSVALLQWLIRCYGSIEDLDSRRKTLEGHLHYLTPPILQQIDDIEVDYKAAGCLALQLLCDQLCSVDSNMLKKSGLMDVFVDALKTDFAMIPTLTPEEESLILYRAMYPAYSSLVSARFRTNRGIHDEIYEDQRISYLTTLYRQQTLYTLTHLSTSGAGSTIAPELSTFLVSQISWIAGSMCLAFVVHLQDTLPMLRRVMCDPFATGHAQMLYECCKAMQAIITACWPRIVEKWWGDCLRAAVGCWANVSDELEDRSRARKSEDLRPVQEELKLLVSLIEDIVGAEYRQARREILEADPDLEQLFKLI